MAAENLIGFDEMRARLEELEARLADANARLDELRAQSAKAQDEARELEEALGKLSRLREEDLRSFSPERRRELYAALEVEALACGKTIYVSGIFLHEGEYIQEHFAEADEVRVNAEKFA